MMKIGELAKIAGCTTDTIRFYEKEGLLPEAERTGSNYRSYHDGHIDRLRFIRNCRALDMTHDEIRTLLHAADGPATGCGTVNALVDDHIDHVNARIEELQQLKNRAYRLAAPLRDRATRRGLRHHAGAHLDGDRASESPADTRRLIRAAVPCGLRPDCAQFTVLPDARS